MTDERQTPQTPDEQPVVVTAPLLRWPLTGSGTGGDPATAYRDAHELLSRSAPREALEVLEPALTQDPANTGLRTLRAWAFLLRAQLGRAEEELRSLVEDNPDDDWARHALGRTLERQSRYAEALGQLRLAAAMTGDPEHEYDVLRVERLLMGA
jgi:predicted Zn-dependent protease